jgi:hypothetical protein
MEPNSQQSNSEKNSGVIFVQLDKQRLKFWSFSLIGVCSKYVVANERSA